MDNLNSNIGDNFLELKHIDKRSKRTGASARAEKTMLELIHECKSKNTTYETIINTWKNANGSPQP
jgi:hypothetical protein